MNRGNEYSNPHFEGYYGLAMLFYCCFLIGMPNNAKYMLRYDLPPPDGEVIEKAKIN